MDNENDRRLVYTKLITTFEASYIVVIAIPYAPRPA